MPKKEKRYLVHTGDYSPYGHFEFGKLYRESYIQQVFRRKIKQCPKCHLQLDFFSGLVLKDAKGDLWKPEVRVELVPFKPEEEYEPPRDKAPTKLGRVPRHN